jgi:O-antigen/teichoic acid export membrane protein
VQVRARFWVEAVLAVLTIGLFILTLIARNWIELVFGVEPDGGSGALEWLIVGGFFVLAVVFSGLARAEWRRAHVAA